MNRTVTTPRGPLWVLAALLCLVFLTGGSTWASEPQLMLLRPAALVAAALALLTLQVEHVRRHAAICALFGAAALLTMLHLVPLPFAWWSALPGRGILVDIDAAVGLGQIARPLSMSPDATLNALYALSVPLAVLLLAVQLGTDAQRRILLVVLGLSLLSALVGLLQAAGSDIALYPLQTETSGLFANRNHQAALLAMILPIAAAASLIGPGGARRQRWRSLAGAALACIVVPLLVVTGSRTGLVLLAVALAFAALIWVRRRTAEGADWAVRIVTPLAFLGLALGLVGVTVLAARDVAIDRLQQAGEDLRLPVWQSIADMLPAYLPWGTGIGSYAEAYQVLEPEFLLRPSFSNHAHNELLEVALTAGLPGLAIMALAGLALVYALRGAFAPGSGAAPAATLARLGCVLMVILLVASASDYPARTPIMSALLALAAVWATRSGEPGADKDGAGAVP